MQGADSDEVSAVKQLLYMTPSLDLLLILFA